ncbi:MAG: POTRA domain-containing protein, partial [Methylobacterium sp.]
MKAGSKLLSALSAAALSSTVLAASVVSLELVSLSEAEAAVLNRVEVRGNQRVDAETVRNLIQFRPGQNYSDADVDQAVTRLFATGLFS